MNMKTLALFSMPLCIAALLLTGGEAPAQMGGVEATKISIHLAGQPGPRTPGMLHVRGYIDDSNGGTLGTDLTLMAAATRIQVADAGAFDVLASLTSCQEKGGRIRCQSTVGEQRIRAIFVPVPKRENIWAFSLRVKGLSEAVTGFGPALSPVELTLTHGTQVRTDVVAPPGGGESECKVRKRGARLRCASAPSL